MSDQEDSDIDHEAEALLAEPDLVDESDAWLISYADIMTLLCCFFILMMVFANFDEPTYQRIAKEVSKYFRGANVEEREDQMTAMMTELIAVSKEENEFEVKRKNYEEITVTLKNSALFDSGKATLRPEADVLLNKLISTVLAKTKDSSIIIEGHTDSVPIGESGGLKEYFPSNWELSAARAANVARKFSEAGYNSKKLRAIGYGKSRPLLPNMDKQGKRIEENMSKNRRVIISIVQPPPKGYKLGFGLIFNKKEVLKKIKNITELKDKIKAKAKIKKQEDIKQNKVKKGVQ
ncbi:MAG: OmpA family protein [Bacteriovoracaceae bacterium]|nr:OmpA family protein [Bacteriovoracaceae bacterium]